MSEFEDLIKEGLLDSNNFILLKGTHEERKLKLIEELIPFDKERLRAAIDSRVNVVPEGLTREETRNLILSRSSKDDTNE